jgi:hypothetical protein
VHAVALARSSELRAARIAWQLVVEQAYNKQHN